MGKAYTQEQRQAALAAVDAGDSRRKVADKLGIGVTTVNSWVAQRAQEGRVAPKLRGKSSLLNDSQRAKLVELIEQHRDASLADLATAMEQACGAKLSIQAVSNYLHRAGFHKDRPAKPVVTDATATPDGTRYQDRHRRDPKDGTYPSSLTDAEFAVLDKLMVRKERRGRPPSYPRRSMLDAVFYIVRTGCQWRGVPHDFPPWTAVWVTFRRWRNNGMLDRMYEALLVQWRLQAQRKAEPTAAIIDSQSVKTTEKGGSAATTAAKRSRGASGTSLWIR